MEVAEHLKATDTLLTERKCEEGLKAAESLLQEVPKDHKEFPEVAYLVARAAYLQNKEIKDKVEQKKLVMRGYEVVQQGQEVNEAHALCVLWHGVLLGTLGSHIPTKEKIANSYKVRELFEKAVSLQQGSGDESPEAKKNLALMYYSLAEWHWAVLNVSFIERGVASTLFGKPPSTTN